MVFIVGYHFYVLMTSFAVDMPHRGSTFKAQFLKSMNTTGSMDSLYRDFQQELKNKYPRPQYMIPICSKPKSVNIYSAICCVC